MAVSATKMDGKAAWLLRQIRGDWLTWGSALGDTEQGARLHDLTGFNSPWSWPAGSLPDPDSEYRITLRFRLPDPCLSFPGCYNKVVSVSEHHGLLLSQSTESDTACAFFPEAPWRSIQASLGTAANLGFLESQKHHSSFCSNCQWLFPVESCHLLCVSSH